MGLTHTQKNYIKRKRKEYAATEIAKYLDVSENTVFAYIQKRWGNKEYTKMLEKSDTADRETISFTRQFFKNWIKQHKGIIVFLTLLVLVAYANGLFNAFVSDDNGIVKNVGNFQFIFSDAVSASFLRPLLNFFIYQLVGLQPFFFRLPSIFFHLGVVLLIYFFISVTLKKNIAVVAAMVFAVHPILVESVTWISGGVYAQYTFFMFLSLLCYALFQGNRKAYVVSLIAYGLALVSSDKAVVFPFILFLYEICFGDIKKNWKKILPYVLLVGIFAFFYIWKIGQRVTYLQAEANEDLSKIDNPLLQIPIAITSYIWLILWPNMLTMYQSEMSFSSVGYVVRLFFFIAFVVFVIISFRKNKHIFFWLSFFLVTLLPTLTPFKISWIVAERYVYCGAIGIFTVFGIFLEKLSGISEERRRFLYAMFAIIVILLMGRTVIRNADWKNEDSLWLAAARTSPSSSQNHNNLGDYYGRNGNLERAVQEFKIAIQIKPNYADAHHNLGNAYRDMGRFDEALEQYKKASSFNPGLWQSYQNAAGIYYSRGNFQVAKEYTEKALKIDPQNLGLLAAMGVIEFKLGNKEKAQQLLIQVLNLDPNNQFAKQALSQIEKGAL